MYDFMQGVIKGRQALIIERKTLFGVEAIRGKYYKYMLYPYAKLLCIYIWYTSFNDLECTYRLLNILWNEFQFVLLWKCDEQVGK